MGLTLSDTDLELLKYCKSGIYALTRRDPDDPRVYIGQSKDIRERLLRHQRCLRTGKHHSYKLKRAWHHSDPGEWEAYVVVTVEDRFLTEQEQLAEAKTGSKARTVLDVVENFWMNLHGAAVDVFEDVDADVAFVSPGPGHTERTPLGYNICPEGRSSSYEWTDERRANHRTAITSDAYRKKLRDSWDTNNLKVSTEYIMYRRERMRQTAARWHDNKTQEDEESRRNKIGNKNKEAHANKTIEEKEIIKAKKQATWAARNPEKGIKRAERAAELAYKREQLVIERAEKKLQTNGWKELTPDQKRRHTELKMKRRRERGRGDRTEESRKHYTKVKARTAKG
jgi:hypothetical protein